MKSPSGELPALRDARQHVAALYQAHALGLVKLAVLMVGDQPTAEDIVQDAFLGLYRRWGKLSNPDRALTYARSSVLNGCRDALRRRSRRIPAALLDPDAPSAEAGVLLAEEHREVLAAAVSGLAVSPDGRAFAVVFRAAGGGRSTVTSADPVTLQIYSVATGQLLRTWTAPLSQRDLYAFGDLSWLDDGHTLAFAYPANSADRDVRTLNITSPGTNLIAGSRAVFSVPTGHTCDSSLLMTADGKSVICGVFAPNNGWCTTGQLALTAYSVATGKLERVLYRYRGRCSFGTAIVVWAKSAELAIGLITVSKSAPPPSPGPLTVMPGVATPGKFTSLPVTLMRGIEYEAPGLIAF